MDHNGAIVVGLGDRNDGIPELTWAASEAQLRQVPLHVVRAYEVAQMAEPWQNWYDRDMLKELSLAAEKRTRQAVEYVRAHWPATTVEADVCEARPADALRDAAGSAALLVVGSRRLGALGGVVLGSVSAHVIAAAASPVVVVGSPSAESRKRGLVVAGIDGSASTPAILEFAFDYANRHGRALQVVYCRSHDRLAGMGWGATPPVPGQVEGWLVEAVSGWQSKYPEVHVQHEVVHEDPVAGLIGASASQELLVVGAGSRHSRMAALLGSVTQGVLHHATCPVAVVHAPST